MVTGGMRLSLIATSSKLPMLNDTWLVGSSLTHFETTVFALRIRLHQLADAREAQILRRVEREVDVEDFVTAIARGTTSPYP